MERNDLTLPEVPVVVPVGAQMRAVELHQEARAEQIVWQIT